ncbi:tyrosinase [Anopheles sinensis]|uniref:Tyrosinase n=1 Tax=Anopheles sinensis TaxID=74873 RepID=A0A084WDW8_ANOSI|nr:tyrosinase [Anopheles sinensis]
MAADVDMSETLIYVEWTADRQEALWSADFGRQKESLFNVNSKRTAADSNDFRLHKNG